MNVECPYCHGELEPGAIVDGRNPVNWLPEGKHMYMVTKSRLEKAGGFRVGKRAGLFWDIPAWYCRTCNRLTIFDAETR